MHHEIVRLAVAIHELGETIAVVPKPKYSAS